MDFSPYECGKKLDREGLSVAVDMELDNLNINEIHNMANTWCDLEILLLNKHKGKYLYSIENFKESQIINTRVKINIV